MPIANNTISSVQLLSRVRLFVTPWITARQVSLSITNSQSLFKLTSTESGMPSNHLILCRPFSCLQSFPRFIPLSQFFTPGGQSVGASASVQFSSIAQSCPTLVTPWTAACQASLSIANSWSLLKLMSIESVMKSKHLILCHPLLLLTLIFPSIRVFSNESVLCIRWPKYWSFSFSISPSNEYSELIAFKMEWLDLLAV